MSASISAEASRKHYYRVLFPAAVEEGFALLLTCNNAFALERVEVSYRGLNRQNGKDFMRRHLYFHAASDLVADCNQRTPLTLQLGGVLPVPPLGAKPEETIQRIPGVHGNHYVASALGPLMLDIDANDYIYRGEICSCAAGKTLCQECWDALLQPARHIIRYLLRDVFCLGRLFDTYSGRRGIHTWCYDERVVCWTRDQRATFMARISAKAVLEAGDDHADVIEDLIKAHVPAQHLRPGMNRQDLFDRFYPRFDVNVSTDAGHLKGLPLSMHHATRYLRIPLPPLDGPYRFDLAHDRPRAGDNVTRPGDMRVFMRAIVNMAFY